MMKKQTIKITGIFATVLLLSSCSGESIDGAALAKEVCECTEKANALPADNPDRQGEQDKCMELQKTNWEKVKGNAEQEKAFNDQFPCGM